MIKDRIKTLKHIITGIGLDPLKIIIGINRFFPFLIEYIKFKKTNGKNKKISMHPCLFDKNEAGGIASGHYFFQDLIVAQKIFLRNPVKHVDIGSRIDGFVAHVATFREIEVFDIRPIQNIINNIKFKEADLQKDINEYKEYTDSISSLHAIEHFGLGRYGDNIDIDGHLKGLNNIYSMLKKDGIFYFSVPMGQCRIEFNAHRVFSLSYLFDYFKGKYEILNFSYVDDKGDLHKDITLEKENIGNNFNCNYGCAIFELKKI